MNNMTVPQRLLRPILLAALLLVTTLVLALGCDAHAAAPDGDGQALTGAGTYDPVTPAPEAAAPGIGTSPGAPTSEPTSEGLARDLYSRLRGGEWIGAFGIGLLLLVRLTRGLVARNLIDWVGTRWGGYAYASIMALSLALGTSLSAGEPPSLGVLSAALGAAWTAIGLHQTAKDAVS